MVKCIKCGIVKCESEFYKHKQTKDGILHKCKECVKEYARSIDRTEYDKIREKTPKRKEWKKRQLIEFRKNNPEKYKAQRLVNNFIRKNRELKPTKSFISGEGGVIHLHHFDYSKPNHVIPCTPLEHNMFHRGKIDIKSEYILILPF